jgi:hypothetical protein
VEESQLLKDDARDAPNADMCDNMSFLQSSSAVTGGVEGVPQARRRQRGFKWVGLSLAGAGGM